MNKPDAYCSDDYASLSAKNASFYYGYEHSVCLECGNKNNGEYCDKHPDADREWCFTAKINGELIVIPFSKLGCSDMFDVNECLLIGIGWILARFELKKP